MASAQIKSCSSKFCVCLFLQNLVIFQTLIVAEPQFPCLFIFGDSFVDNGNNNYLHPSFRVNYLPYGIDFPAGPTGRFTNGRNIADFIAKMLGFKNFIPPFANGTTDDILRGLNYASGGSGILNETGSQYGVTNLSDQISNHEITISRIQKLLEEQSATKKHLSSCLYYVGIGSKDYLLNYLPQLATIYTPNHFAALLITQYSNHLQRLYENGARKVAVVGVDKIGCTPFLIRTYGSPNSSSCIESINNILQIFNQQLKLLINDLNHDYPKAKFVYTRYTPFSASTRDIKIVSEACCKERTLLPLCLEGSVPCSSRDEYRFWDGVHPTEAAVAAAANTTYNDISPLFPHCPTYLWDSFDELRSYS
ncbi:GDSL esterase/lipase At1g29670-like [Salvia miltiorrhiza]|uniref:GDSL esterase/lipase At1g29670-like n=1 Tax=Salvia miltiorrhiza TaxID=226208 RepID=UPI0025ABA535|nr:GDSL esterase/lipase At1g29670-like [Salvia miltiorrhiza]